ncbi:hypothetical protein GCM10009836_45600 [Pseudonocardia ailaonensis]|uniref:Uncharacterized protein n=1 Tax=Pseudonocardia ailaonensis TaxID=367279 RepID=A0ABN2NAD3_9PSEU
MREKNRALLMGIHSHLIIANPREPRATHRPCLVPLPTQHCADLGIDVVIQNETQ